MFVFFVFFPILNYRIIVQNYAVIELLCIYIYIHCIFTVLNIHVTVSLRLHIARLFGIQVINESGSTIIC